MLDDRLLSYYSSTGVGGEGAQSSRGAHLNFGCYEGCLFEGGACERGSANLRIHCKSTCQFSLLLPFTHASNLSLLNITSKNLHYFIFRLLGCMDFFPFVFIKSSC